jgi:hypothetical protein
MLQLAVVQSSGQPPPLQSTAQLEFLQSVVQLPPAQVTSHIAPLLQS